MIIMKEIRGPRLKTGLSGDKPLKDTKNEQGGNK